MIKTEKNTNKNYIDPALITALCNGDAKAFENLYTHMGGSIEDFLTAMLHSREDARELTQEVFANVWSNRNKFISEKNLKGFIYTSAKFHALDLLKHRKVEQKYISLALNSNEEYDFSADDHLSAQEMELLIRITLDTMPEKKRRVFEMSRFEGKSEDEIALTLNLTKQTVQVYLSNTLKELRDVISMFVTLFLSI